MSRNISYGLRLRHCPKDGTIMQELKPAYSGWEQRWRCACGIRVVVSAGDAMGGSSDTVQEFDEPFRDGEELLS